MRDRGPRAADLPGALKASGFRPTRTRRRWSPVSSASVTH